MALRYLAWLLVLVPLAVWTGAAIGLTFFTTPVVFTALDRDSAARLVAQLFPGYFRLLLGCQVAAVAGAVLITRAGNGLGRTRWLLVGLLAAALLVTLVGGFVVEPRVAEVQARITSFVTETDSPARQEFRRWHSISSSLNVLGMVLTLGAWLELIRRLAQRTL